jgi:hypothetical protein
VTEERGTEREGKKKKKERGREGMREDTSVPSLSSLKPFIASQLPTLQNPLFCMVSDTLEFDFLSYLSSPI